MSAQLIEILFILIVFVFGISFGSFLNVIIERIPRGKTIGGRSQCPTCSHELGLTDLVPILSFFVLKSRCRYCQNPISWQYPLIEFFTGLLFVLLFLYFPLPYSVFYIITFSVLLALFVIDLKFGVVPEIVVYPTAVFVILVRLLLPTIESVSLYLRLISDKSGFGKYLVKAGFFSTHLFLQFQPVLLTIACALLVALFFYLLVIFTKGRGMGTGDIIYAFLVALIAGFPNMFVALFLTFLIGSVVSVFLIIAKHKKFKDTVPLGPFLSLGAFISVIWGNHIVDFYLSFIR